MNMKRRLIQKPVIAFAFAIAARNSVSRFRRQYFVGIENENPLVPEREIFQRPVFFLRPGAIEFELHDPRAKLFRDALRPIRALRVDHENFIGPPD